MGYWFLVVLSPELYLSFVTNSEGMYLCERGEMLLCTTVRSEGHVYRLTSTSLLSLIPRIVRLTVHAFSLFL